MFPSNSGNYLDFVNPLHVVAQLVQILDVAVADFAHHEGRLVAAGGALAGLHGGRAGRLQLG